MERAPDAIADVIPHRPGPGGWGRRWELAAYGLLIAVTMLRVGRAGRTIRLYYVK